MCVSDIYPAEFWDAPGLFWSVSYLDLLLQCNHQSSHHMHTCEMRLVAMDKFIIFENFHHTHIIKKGQIQTCIKFWVRTVRNFSRR